MRDASAPTRRGRLLVLAVLLLLVGLLTLPGLYHSWRAKEP
ncbi:MAG TPA: hypothetical protein VEJ18_18275 [Planctomycetota bacterium]|nr:hypothetical protein [Planctomycetota bacterium]